MADIFSIILHPHVTAISYAIIFIKLGYLCIHYRWIAPYLWGTFLHMFVVSVRSTLIVIHPPSTQWYWTDTHRITALIAALCGVWLLIQLRHNRV